MFIISLLQYAGTQSNIPNRLYLPSLRTYRHNRSDGQSHRRNRLDQREASECVDWYNYRGMYPPSQLAFTLDSVPTDS